MFVDSHIHLTHRLYDQEFPAIITSISGNEIAYFDRNELIDTFKDKGIRFCVEPGIELESNERILELNNQYPEFLYPAIGVHPTRVSQTKWSRRQELTALMENPKVVAIGELGLDYHPTQTKQNRVMQKVWFIWQLEQAHKLKLPLILHIRDADDDVIRILRRNKSYLHGGVCHCFKKGPSLAKIYTQELGLMLGIGASVLQEGCSQLEQAIKETPISHLLLETDGPYVKPEKPEYISGKKWKKARNTSIIIPDIAKRVAELKGIDVSEVEKVTTENALRVFNIQKRY